MMTDQQELSVIKKLNKLYPLVLKRNCMFYGSIKNLGCILLNYFQDSPSEGCIMTLSTLSCEYCHAIC